MTPVAFLLALADLLSVQGHPTGNIRHRRQIRFIMKDGSRYHTLSWR